MVRAAIERLYKGTCRITNKQKVVDPITKRTTDKDVLFCDNEPCRLSYESIQSADYDHVTSEIKQQIKLFMRPEVMVVAGAKVVVTQNGRTVTYKAAGQPAVYSNHQEILLELDGDKA